MIRVKDSLQGGGHHCVCYTMLLSALVNENNKMAENTDLVLALKVDSVIASRGQIG